MYLWRFNLYAFAIVDVTEKNKISYIVYTKLFKRRYRGEMGQHESNVT